MSGVVCLVLCDNNHVMKPLCVKLQNNMFVLFSACVRGCGAHCSAMDPYTLMDAELKSTLSSGFERAVTKGHNRAQHKRDQAFLAAVRDEFERTHTEAKCAARRTAPSRKNTNKKGDEKPGTRGEARHFP